MNLIHPNDHISSEGQQNVDQHADVAFGLWSLARSWRTFPGARLSNDQGLEATSEFVAA